jgi:hypothetical protein
LNQSNSLSTFACVQLTHASYTRVTFYLSFRLYININVIRRKYTCCKFEVSRCHINAWECHITFNIIIISINHNDLLFYYRVYYFYNVNIKLTNYILFFSIVLIVMGYIDIFRSQAWHHLSYFIYRNISF